MSHLAVVRSVRVVIHAVDPVVRAGLVSHLRHDRRLAEVPSERAGEAEVIVVAVDVMDVAALDMLGTLSDGPDARFAIVVGQRWQVHVSAAVDRGVRAVVWRDSFNPVVFAQKLITVAEGGGSFPADLQGALMEQVQWTRREALAPRGLSASGISQREVDVLRLLADGNELAEIAQKLSYSERTVKYILYGLMKRMNLRNRTHAVVHAVRSGLI
jgi:DNA-binding NarL/FixJ family response regulator